MLLKMTADDGVVFYVSMDTQRSPNSRRPHPRVDNGALAGGDHVGIENNRPGAVRGLDHVALPEASVNIARVDLRAQLALDLFLAWAEQIAPYSDANRSCASTFVLCRLCWREETKVREADCHSLLANLIFTC